MMEKVFACSSFDRYVDKQYLTLKYWYVQQDLERSQALFHLVTGDCYGGEYSHNI